MMPEPLLDHQALDALCELFRIPPDISDRIDEMQIHVKVGHNPELTITYSPTEIVSPEHREVIQP